MPHVKHGYYNLLSSFRKNKKYLIITPEGRWINFGATDYEDFTQHKNETRKALYLARHRPRETWTRSGINTPGFWARWLLWNYPTIEESIVDIERRFNITIRYSR